MNGSKTWERLDKGVSHDAYITSKFPSNFYTQILQDKADFLMLNMSSVLSCAVLVESISRWFREREAFSLSWFSV